MNSQPQPDHKPMPDAQGTALKLVRARVPVVEAASLSWPSPIEVQLWRP